MMLSNLRFAKSNLTCASRMFVCALAALTLSAEAFAEDVALASTVAPEVVEAETEEEQPIPMCKTELRLSGAVFDARRPEHSFAVLQAMPSRSGAVYRVGMWVAGYELVQVAPRGVLLRDRDGECCSLPRVLPWWETTGPERTRTSSASS
jgi:hypothetical protein